MNASYNKYLDKKTDEVKLETLTTKYLRGELDLKKYQVKVRELDKQLDLRKVASGLKMFARVPTR